jgi:hypothetical protein
MRRLRGGDERTPAPPGGAGAPPGDTTIPCQELADGGRPGPARRFEGNGPTRGRCSDPEAGNGYPKARPGAEKSCDGAPRGARVSQKETRLNNDRTRLAALHHPLISGVEKKPRQSGAETTACPGPLKNTGDDACQNRGTSPHSGLAGLPKFNALTPPKSHFRTPYSCAIHAKSRNLGLRNSVNRTSPVAQEMHQPVVQSIRPEFQKE